MMSALDHTQTNHIQQWREKAYGARGQFVSVQGDANAAAPRVSQSQCGTALLSAALAQMCTRSHRASAGTQAVKKQGVDAAQGCVLPLCSFDPAFREPYPPIL